MKLDRQFELQSFGVIPKEGKKPTYECGYVGFDEDGLYYHECLDKYNRRGHIEYKIKTYVRDYCTFYPKNHLYLACIFHKDSWLNIVVDGFILHDGGLGYYEPIVIDKDKLTSNNILYTLNQLKKEHEKN